MRPQLRRTPHAGIQSEFVRGNRADLRAIRIALVAGYSATPLSKKLGIKPESRVLLLNAPAGFALEEVTPVTRAQGVADVILSFHLERRELAKRLPVLRERLRQDGRLWIAWPKRASKVPTDITEDVVREIALENRLVDNKVAAIDETWSGLQLVIRLSDRLP
jgi:hypothetical protein